MEYCRVEGGRLFAFSSKYKLAVVIVTETTLNFEIVNDRACVNSKDTWLTVASTKNLVGHCFLILHLEYGC